MRGEEKAESAFKSYGLGQLVRMQTPGANPCSKSGATGIWKYVLHRLGKWLVIDLLVYMK